MDEPCGLFPYKQQKLKVLESFSKVRLRKSYLRPTEKEKENARADRF